MDFLGCSGGATMRGERVKEVARIIDIIHEKVQWPRVEIAKFAAVFWQFWWLPNCRIVFLQKKIRAREVGRGTTQVRGQEGTLCFS